MSQTRLIMEEYDKCPFCGKYYDVELGCECWEEEEVNDCKCGRCGEYYHFCACEDGEKEEEEYE